MEGERKETNCDSDFSGTVTVECDGVKWTVKKDNCVLRAIFDLQTEAQNLNVETLPDFVDRLQETTVNEDTIITDSPATIFTIVDILNSVAGVSKRLKLNETVMSNILGTVDVIVSENAQESWTQLNNDTETDNTSSSLLQSVEDVGSNLSDEQFNITRERIQLNRIIDEPSVNLTLGVNQTVDVQIPETGGIPLTIIAFSTLHFVLPARNASNFNSSSKSTTSINGDVVVVRANSDISFDNISFTFEKKNETLGNPVCVFWNFSLLDGIGGWDSTGCEVKLDPNDENRVTCECNHTTSFSVLMSPFSIDSIILSYITYIGVGISMGSLVVCLIIEGIVWRAMTRNDTSYMRHVSIVNIAVSLLIANICFIIGASLVDRGKITPVNPCSTATFFGHFFYLALFFWMLLSALLLFYRTVMVFSQMSRSTMMAIGFSVGYGAPLLIAVITVAVTAPGKGYIAEKDACWLNWTKTKALLAFVIPALTIVAVNLVILCVVLYKMLRRGVGASTQPDEKHSLMVIARCVAILTPLFGLTWGFGIGTMVSSAFGVHVVFTILNSFQGFFILVFGTLLDGKIREALTGRFKFTTSSSNRTRSTSAGQSSSSGWGVLQRLRRRRTVVFTGPMALTGPTSAQFD
ncbi:adhesion G protein-coupled receptor F5-like [Chanos chanos]|uniref:Adhesion G protein-coupled receptor F5-like n=1 Tax=Chanos chanos TaxID=29144 RepID=A0A6J2V6W4_CHACN|nr:adhesion G protein-coupled receptor F5-like [Chanos chanos]